MDKITFYSTHCPKCVVLEKKLKEKNIDYKILGNGSNLIFPEIWQDSSYSKSYIIRQAYYLFVIPVIILMGDNRYTDIWKKDIEKNAELLIWIIYIGHIIYFKKFSLQVPAVFMMCYFVGYSTYIEYGPFAANSIYTTMDQMFVTGSHNSYITILYRLGPIGLYFLLLGIS